MTCLVGRRLGSDQDQLAHYPLRNLAASLLGLVSRKYAKSSHTLKPRLARTCLKHFLDPTIPLGANYGAIIGLQAIGGPEVVRALILPNLKEYEVLIREPIEDDLPNKADAEMVVGALLGALRSLEEEGVSLTNGFVNGDSEEIRARLSAKVGELIGSRILGLGRPQLVKTVLSG